MAGYSLVIDISSDKENMRHSTPIKTLPLNLIRTLNISDSSTEVYRGSEAELDSTWESECSPKRIRLSHKKKKATKVTFNLPPAVPRQKNKVDSDSDDFYEEADSSVEEMPLKPSRKPNVQPEQETQASSLNDLIEPTKPPEISREEKEHLEAMIRDLEEEERQITYMTAGRGRGPHQIRNYISRPPIIVKKEIPHCHGLPASMASRGALSRPAPGRGCDFCYVMGRGRGTGYCKYH